MSKDLLVLADEYAAATATFARALALKDEADSMSPIAREAGDKRAVLAEALAALDTAQPERAPLEADMFWDHEDPETFGHDIETIASNYGLGDEIEIDCAKRMPGIKVRVIQSEPEGELTWERIDFQEAAHGIKQGGQQ